MALTLADLSKIETDTLRKGVVDIFLMESSVMELCPWETINQLATTIAIYQAMPDVGFRNVNEAFAESTGTYSQKVESIYLMGGDLDVDIAIARAANTIADARADQEKLQLKAIAYKFNDKFINGDPTAAPKEFKGLQKRVADVVAAGYTSQSIDTGGTAGAARDAGILYDTGNRHNFLNKLDQLLYSIKGHKPDFLLMNQKCLLALRSLLRQEKLLDTTRDMFDRVVDVYQGARLLDIGLKADQSSEIITNTEDPDNKYTSDVSTSIYAVRFSVGEYLWGIQQYPLEARDLGELQAKPVYRTRVDWHIGLAHVDPRSIARLRNIFPDGIVQS